MIRKLLTTISAISMTAYLSESNINAHFDFDRSIESEIAATSEVKITAHVQHGEYNTEDAPRTVTTVDEKGIRFKTTYASIIQQNGTTKEIIRYKLSEDGARQVLEEYRDNGTLASITATNVEENTKTFQEMSATGSYVVREDFFIDNILRQSTDFENSLQSCIRKYDVNGEIVSIHNFNNAGKTIKEIQIERDQSGVLSGAIKTSIFNDAGKLVRKKEDRLEGGADEEGTYNIFTLSSLDTVLFTIKVAIDQSHQIHIDHTNNNRAIKVAFQDQSRKTETVDTHGNTTTTVYYPNSAMKKSVCVLNVKNIETTIHYNASGVEDFRILNNRNTGKADLVEGNKKTRGRMEDGEFIPLNQQSTHSEQ
jgi:antitoxin component YwqK of YwqJK toxin-antitoxin module